MAEAPRMDAEYQQMIVNTAKALTKNQADAAKLANDAYNASLADVQQGADLATAQNDVTFNQGRDRLNGQFQDASATTLNKLSTAAAQAQAATNTGAANARLGAQTAYNNANANIQDAYLANLTNAQQNLGRAGIEASYNQEQAEANRALAQEQEAWERSWKEQQNDLSNYANTITRFNTTSACDAEVARLKKSNDPQRQQKIEYVEAQKAAILAGAYAQGYGSGGRGGYSRRGRSGRSSGGGGGADGDDGGITYGVQSATADAYGNMDPMQQVFASANSALAAYQKAAGKTATGAADKASANYANTLNAIQQAGAVNLDARNVNWSKTMKYLQDHPTASANSISKSNLNDDEAKAAYVLARNNAVSKPKAKKQVEKDLYSYVQSKLKGK